MIVINLQQNDNQFEGRLLENLIVQQLKFLYKDEDDF